MPPSKQENSDFYLTLNMPEIARVADAPPVSTEILGESHIALLPYVNPDGSPLSIDTDFSGAKRAASTPTPGPFENLKSGNLKIKISTSKTSAEEKGRVEETDKKISHNENHR